jgi:hypothetical protein
MSQARMELKERQSPEAEGANLIHVHSMLHLPFSTAKRETGEGLTGFEHLSSAEAKGPDQYGHPTFHPAKELPSPPAFTSADLLIKLSAFSLSDSHG